MKVAILAQGAVVLCGCRVEGDAPLEVPPPGSVVVVAVESVEAASPGGLIPNGDFAEWYAGLPFPTGFDAPKNAASSIVERDRMWGHLGTTGFSARQTWLDLATETAPDAGFSTSVQLEANTTYQFEVVASASPGMVARIGAYARGDAGALTPLAPSLVEVSGEAPTRYMGTFQTGSEGDVLLCSQASPLAEAPGVVTWSLWAIHAAVKDHVAEEIPIDRGYWVENSLAHVRSQLSLYGGPEAWSESLNDLHKNLGRVYREAESTKGNAILGYDQYIFQKAELQYVQEVEDFVHTSVEDSPVYRPAFQALLRLDRALAARGTQLILVPVPDRVHLYVDQIHRPAAAGPPSYLAHTRLIEGLLDQGVLAIDVAPLLKHRRSESNVVYWKTEYGVPSYTLAEIADYVAPLFHEVSAEAVTLNLSKEPMPLGGRAVPGLDPTLQKSVTLEENELLYVIHYGSGSVYSPAPESSILVVGSLATVDAEVGASLAAQLAYALGKKTAVLPDPISDQDVPSYLIEKTTPALEKARVVLFCFPEYVLVQPGW